MKGNFATVLKIQKALEGAGISFTDDAAEEIGVRLLKKRVEDTAQELGTEFIDRPRGAATKAAPEEELGLSLASPRANNRNQLPANQRNEGRQQPPSAGFGRTNPTFPKEFKR